MTDLEFRCSPFRTAWNHIFTGSDKPNTIEALRELFRDENEALEERELTRFHEIVLGLTSASLEQEITADITNIDSADSDGYTALMWAAQRGDSKSIDQLIQAGADLNKSNRYGMSALLYAAQAADLKCIRALLTAGADSTATDRDKRNALHWAIYLHDEQDIVESLIESGTNVNGRNMDGCSPLTNAAFYHNVISAEALLDYGADIENIDNEGDTPLYESLQHHADNVLQLLLSRGAIYTTI